MLELKDISGLPVSWNAARKRLLLNERVQSESHEPSIRTCREMVDVLYSRNCYDYDTLYYMYRGVSLKKDSENIKNAGLRYDITVICPGLIGKEFIKTAGHYHPEKTGTYYTWPEVYEVLHGKAHYLIQSPVPGHADRLQDVIIVEANVGDKVLIPPGYGHITINPGNDYLIMSNWVASNFSSLYEPIRKMFGGAYFEILKDNALNFVPNKRYEELPDLKHCGAITFEEFCLKPSIPMYSAFFFDTNTFKFLTHPEEFPDLFSKYLEKLTAVV